MHEFRDDLLFHRFDDPVKRRSICAYAEYADVEERSDGPTR